MKCKQGRKNMIGWIIGLFVFIGACLGFVCYLSLRKRETPPQTPKKKITISENENETIVKIEKDN